MIRRAHLAFVALSTATVVALAHPYPERPVRIIVPTASGGPSDACARVLSRTLQNSLGTSLVIDNVPGATGNIGLQRAAAAPPDGYTIAMPSAANSANFSARPARSFDLEASLVPIGVTCLTAHTLVVSPKLNIRSVPELVRYGRDNPGKLTFSSIGFGSSQHFMGELFASVTGIQMVHVPYRGEALAAPELASGRVSLAFMAGAKPFIDGQLVVPLATTNHATWAPLPDLPPLRTTMPELAGFTYNGWNGLMAPVGTPPEIVRRLSDALQAAQRDEDTRASLNGLGAVPGTGTPQALRQQLQSDATLFRTIITERRLSFED